MVNRRASGPILLAKILNLSLQPLAGKKQDCSDVWLQPHTNGSALTALKLVEADLTTNH